MAVLDAGLRSEGRSLGGGLTQGRDHVAAGAVVGLVHSDDAGALATLLAEAESLVGAGFTRLKVKIAPGDDLSALTELRRAFPDLGLQADANGSYRLEEPGHLEALRALDDLDLLCVEQPLDPDDLGAHARLAREIDTPVCLDESINSLGRLRDAIALQACDVICIKPARLGGLLQAVAAHDMCMAAGIGVWCGGMLETALARSANAAIATLPGFCLPGDLSGGERFVEKDPFLAGSGPEVPRGPQAIVPVHRGPGVGPSPEQQALDLVTTRSHWASLG
jgi:O-succinylbenzoate synthase